MPLRGRSVVFAAYMIITTITSTRAAQVGSVEEGHKFAREICSECHLLGEEPGLSINANAPTFEDIANTPGMTETALRTSLQTWHKNMPNLIIRDEEADSLVAYVLSLKKTE